MRRLVLLLSFALATGAAAQPRPGTETLQMDSDHANVTLALGGNQERFSLAAGALEYDPANPQKSTLTFSLDTGSIEPEAARPSFDPEHFPELRIISTADAKPGKNGMLVLPLNVTIRDITRAALFQVSFKRAAQAVTLHAEGVVKAADFHLGKGDVAFIIDAPFVQVNQR
jgi:polyisoprenoid-binding protein YceI